MQPSPKTWDHTIEAIETLEKRNETIELPMSHPDLRGLRPAAISIADSECWRRSRWPSWTRSSRGRSSVSENLPVARRAPICACGSICWRSRGRGEISDGNHQRVQCDILVVWGKLKIERSDFSPAGEQRHSKVRRNACPRRRLIR